MGLFDKSEEVAVSVKKVLRSRGIDADVMVSRGLVFVSVPNIGCNGTELSITWADKSLSVSFFLGTAPALYQLSVSVVDRYNDLGVFSRAFLCDSSQIGNRECNKAWIEGVSPGGSRVKADDVELYLDLILEDIFDTHAEILKLFYINLKLVSLA